MELLELLTGAHLYTQTFAPAAAQVAGYSRRGVGQACPDPVSVEIWSKVIDNTGACSATDDTTPLYWRTIWPRATFTLGDVSFANEIATISLTGFAEPNPAFTSGCFDDVPTEITLEPTSPEHYFLDAAGPPALACGYIEVPAIVLPPDADCAPATSITTNSCTLQGSAINTVAGQVARFGYSTTPGGPYTFTADQAPSPSISAAITGLV
jgi:hypothetical protein